MKELGKKLNYYYQEIKMEIKIKGNKVTVGVKTTTVDKQGQPTFGRNTYEQMKELVKVVEREVSYTSGARGVPSRVVIDVYNIFRREHKIPLVYSEMDGITYKGETITEM
jgi:hypothetical protein